MRGRVRVAVPLFSAVLAATCACSGTAGKAPVADAPERPEPVAAARRDVAGEAARLRRDGRPAEALDLLRGALAADSAASGELLVEAARSRADLGDPQAALVLLERALARDPRLAEAWLARAELQERCGAREEALASCRAAIALPGGEAAWPRLAGLLAARARDSGREADWGEAAAILDSLARRDPQGDWPRCREELLRRWLDPGDLLAAVAPAGARPGAARRLAAQSELAGEAGVAAGLLAYAWGMEGDSTLPARVGELCLRAGELSRARYWARQALVAQGSGGAGRLLLGRVLEAAVAACGRREPDFDDRLVLEMALDEYGRVTEPALRAAAGARGAALAEQVPTAEDRYFNRYDLPRKECYQWLWE